MDERTKKAFDAAADTVKQLITIASAIVGAVVTFGGSGSGAFLEFKAAGSATPISLLLLVLSVAAGLAALMNLTGTLGNTAIQNPTPYGPGIRFFVGLQVFLFIAGVFGLAVFAPHWDWSAVKFW